MPSDFTGRRTPRRKTLADLMRELHAGRPTTARPASTTSPVAGPGRIRNQQGVAERNRETEIQRRQRLAQDALRQLRGE